MADRYRTPGGWTVEVVQLAAGDRLRIRHHGYYIADVRSADDLARWIPADELLQLERDTLMPAAWPTRGLAGTLRVVALERKDRVSPSLRPGHPHRCAPGHPHRWAVAPALTAGPAGPNGSGAAACHYAAIYPAPAR